MRQTQFIYAVVETDMMGSLNVKENTVRFNKYRTKFIFKTYKEEPNLVNVPLYTKERIKQMLKKDEWQSKLI
jgi:hypothetical protein